MYEVSVRPVRGEPACGGRGGDCDRGSGRGRPTLGPEGLYSFCFMSVAFSLSVSSASLSLAHSPLDLDLCFFFRGCCIRKPLAGRSRIICVICVNARAARRKTKKKKPVPNGRTRTCTAGPLYREKLFNGDDLYTHTHWSVGPVVA